MENSPKTKSEWKEKILTRLSPQDFQDLCFDILNNNQFENPKPRGQGSDGGRDLEAEFIYSFGKQKVRQTCWFQCKRYSKETPLNYREFSSELTKAETRGVNRFIIISNKDMTSDAKSEIIEWNKNHKCQVDDWTGTLFLDLLFEFPDICKIYFPDEIVPQIVDISKPQEIIPLSKNLGERFGVEIKLNIQGINPNNPFEIGEKLKEALLNLDTDLNLKALIYEKASMFFFSINQPDNSILFLNKSLDITPKNVKALLIKGYILERSDHLEESNKIYNEILTFDKQNIFALNNKGFNLMREGKLNDSLKLINLALSINPKFVVSIKNKLNLLKQMENYDEAKSLLSQNEDCFDKSTDLIIEKVDILIHELDLKNAFISNEEILKKDPNNILAINNLGVIYEKNARFQNSEKYFPLALECFEKVVKLDEKFTIGWANKISILMARKDPSESIRETDQIYETFPNSPDILNKKGIVFLNQNEPRKAKKYFDSALKKRYKGDFLFNRAGSNFQMKQYESALKDLETLLTYEKKNSLAWNLKGACLRILRRGNSKQCFINAEKFKEKPISLLE